MRGCWIQTHGTRTFRLDRPNAGDVDILDIAHSLSVLSRFNGHTLWSQDWEWGYSVAQHSVLVARVADQIAHKYVDPSLPCDIRMMGLLHDAHEAYVGDVTSPMKRLLGDSWKAIETNAEEAVRVAFNLPVRPSTLEVVKAADAIVLATEARDLLKCGPVGWAAELPDPMREYVEPWRPAYAKDEFLRTFWTLQQEADLARAQA